MTSIGFILATWVFGPSAWGQTDASLGWDPALEASIWGPGIDVMVVAQTPAHWSLARVEDVFEEAEEVALLHRSHPSTQPLSAWWVLSPPAGRAARGWFTRQAQSGARWSLWAEPTSVPLALSRNTVLAGELPAGPEAHEALPTFQSQVAMVGYTVSDPRVQRLDSAAGLGWFGVALEDALWRELRVWAGDAIPETSQMWHAAAEGPHVGRRLASATERACDAVGQGGVVAIMHQTLRGNRRVPVEWFAPVWSAIRACTDRGVLVVVPVPEPMCGNTPGPHGPTGALWVHPEGVCEVAPGMSWTALPVAAPSHMWVGEELWSGAAVSTARVAGLAWRVQAEAWQQYGEPVRPEDLRRVIVASTGEGSEMADVPNLAAALDRLQGPKRADRASVPSGIKWLVFGLSVAGLLSLGLITWVLGYPYWRRWLARAR